MGEYATPQTEVRIDGYMSNGNNVISLQPIVGMNKKGGAVLSSTGTLFIEPKRF